MKDTDLIETFSLFEEDECQCAEKCLCGKASDIFNDYADGYFLPTKSFPIHSQETNLEDDDFEFEFPDDDDEEIFIKKQEVLLISTKDIEDRKAELKGTKYFNNDFAITNCHLIKVEIAFRNMPMELITESVNAATDGNFEILKLKDHFVEFIAHFEPEFYTSDDVNNHLYDFFGIDRYSIVMIYPL